MLNRSLSFCCVAVSLFLWGQALHAQADCVSLYSGGGEIPTPFTLSNQHVELADGEQYELIGQVVSGARLSDSLPYDAAQAWFQPDFNAQPWLASQARLANPGYPMENAPWSSWTIYSQKAVRLTVVAHGVIQMDENQNPQYVIFLRPAPNSCDMDEPSGKKHHKH
ncbi:MAG: hypothetical protein P4M08_03830 [Oligoflexia bacterium]|nr:hypothetical protein [Oligoflexia bacterium]